MNGAIKKIKTNGIICGHDCEAMFQNLNAEQKAEIHKNLEIDYIKITKSEGLYGVHSGVVKGVFEILDNNYQILQCGISSGILYSLPNDTEKLNRVKSSYETKNKILNFLKNKI